MDYKQQLRARIDKGIEYFWSLKASKFDGGQKLLLTRFLNLLKEYHKLEDIRRSEKIDKNAGDKLFEEGKKIFTS